MKKLITSLAGAGLLAMTAGLVGCGDKSAVTEKKEVSTPGGTTTTREKKEMKQTGENPPPADTTHPIPPRQ